jgi:hypothetical protein
VREEAAFALGCIGSPAVIPSLLRSYFSDKDNREQTKDSLLRLHCREERFVNDVLSRAPEGRWGAPWRMSYFREVAQALGITVFPDGSWHTFDEALLPLANEAPEIKETVILHEESSTPF